MRYLLAGLTLMLAMVLGLILGVRSQVWFDSQSQPRVNSPAQSQPIVPSPRQPVNKPLDDERALSLDTSSLSRSASVFDMLLAMYRNMATMSPEQVQEFILKVAQSDLGPIRRELIEVGIQRLTTFDPGMALAFIDANSQIPEQDFYPVALESWAYLNPQEAIAFVLAETDEEKQRHFAFSLLGNEQIITAGLNGKLEALWPERYIHAIKFERQTWGKSPAESFKIGLEMQRGDKLPLLQETVASWASEAPEAAFEAVQALPESDEKDFLLATVMVAYCKTDPEWVMNFFEANTHLDLMHHELVYELIHHEPKRMLPYLEQYERGWGIRRAIESWATKEPDEAIAYVDAHSFEPEIKAQLYRSSFKAYLHHDPDAALNWLGQRFDGLPAMLQHTWIDTGDDKIRTAVVTAMENATDPAVRTWLMTNIAVQKTEDNSAHGVEWLQQFKGEAGYTHTLAEVATLLAKRNPDQVLTLIEPYLHEAGMKQQGGSLAEVILNRDHEFGENWIVNLPTGQFKDLALYKLIEHVHRSDPAKANAYIQQIGTAHLRDEAAVNLARVQLRNSSDTPERIISELQLSERARDRVMLLASQQGYVIH